MSTQVICLVKTNSEYSKGLSLEGEGKKMF